MPVPRSKIAWTDYSGGDANFVLRGRAAGDCEVSPGCANCYAGAILRRSELTPKRTTVFPGKLGRLARVKFVPLLEPFRRGPGSRPLVFVCDMGDLFHEAVPDNVIFDALDMMTERADVDWQVLTKRPARMAALAHAYPDWPANVWTGVTVENQKAADERIPLMLQVPAAVRFLSCEPLLNLIDIRGFLGGYCSWESTGNGPFVNWVIVGGESGPKRRPFDVDWARSLRDQCAAAGVPFFYKQGSALRPGLDDVLDGRTYKAFPETPAATSHPGGAAC
jgi:protein gp37